MAEIKKLIDLTRLTEYHGLLKNWIDLKKFKPLSDKVGTVPSTIGEGENEQVVNDLVDYIQKKVALVNADAAALEERVGKNETAVQTTLPAYIDNAVATEIAKIVNENNNGSIDTLNEIAAWIVSEIDGAESMKNAIKVLQGTDGSTQTKDSASIPGVKLYIDSLVADKNVTAGVAEGEILVTATDESATKGNKVTVASTAKLQAAVTRAENSVQSVEKATSVENYVTLSVAGAADATVAISDAALKEKIDGMYTDMQGDTTETVASVEEKVDALHIADADDITALFQAD